MTKLLAVTAAAWLALPASALAKERIQAGLWEVSATVEIPGIGTALPPTTQTECLSQKDVDADPVPVLDKGTCRAADVHRSGDKISWKLVCDGSPPGRGEGEITYKSPTAYDGWMTLETSGMTVRTTIRAHRVGGC
jgi:hypothetical protein